MVVIISVMFLERRDRTERQRNPYVMSKNQTVQKEFHTRKIVTYGSVCVQSKLGPRTIAMLPGVILFASWYSLSLAKNLIRYL